MKFLAVLACTVILAACGGSQSDAPVAPGSTAAPAEEKAHDHDDGHSHGGDEHSADATIVPPGEAKPGDTSTCPVSGETFVVAETSPKVEHDGMTYYFCCGGCAQKFAANPSKFVEV